MVRCVVAGLDGDESMTCGYDGIGCCTYEDSISAGSGEAFLLGAAETWWKEGMSEQQLEDVMINCMTGCTDRDIKSGFMAACYVVYIFWSWHN